MRVAGLVRADVVRVLYLAAALATAPTVACSGRSRAPSLELRTDGARESVCARLLPLPLEQDRKVGTALDPEDRDLGTFTLGGATYPALATAAANSRVVWPTELKGEEFLDFGLAASGPAEMGSVQATVRVAWAPEGHRVEEALYTGLVPVAALMDSGMQVRVRMPAQSGRGALVLSARLETSELPEGSRFHWLNPRISCPADTELLPVNVLLICVDTLRADRLIPGQSPDISMPRVASRLADAVVFENAYANSSWSLPSMASILTGRLPGEHNAGRRTRIAGPTGEVDYSARAIAGGIELSLSTGRYRFQMLHRSVSTLQELLGASGWYTAAIHNNGYINPPTRVLKGMDAAFQYPSVQASTATDQALEWLKTNGRGRFFLFLHYIEPHQWPGELPPSVRDKTSVASFTEDDRRAVVATYDELVGRTDEALERLFEGLETAGLFEDTLVILTADHGERFFERGVRGSHGGSFLESVVRVPLAIWAPGLAPRRVSRMVSSIDIAPTVLRAVGLSAPEGMSGHDLLNARPARPVPVTSEFVLWSADQAARWEGPWKFVLKPESGDNGLYDLQDDPGERQNLVAERPDLARRLESMLVDYRQRSLAAFTALDYQSTRMDPRTIESLRALGYIR